MNNVNVNEIAGRDVFACPMVEEGNTLDALKGLMLAVGNQIMQIDHEQRASDFEYEGYGTPWCRVTKTISRDVKPLTYHEQQLVIAYEQARRALIVAAIKSPHYAHSRTRFFMERGYTYIYHRDPKSPSGVILCTEGPSEIVDPLIRQHRNNSPLSPTEGFRRAG